MAKLAMNVASRVRSPTAPMTSPKALHDVAVTSMAASTAGTAAAGICTPAHTTPSASITAVVRNPKSTAGTSRPANITPRFAGEASTGVSVPPTRSFCTDIAGAKSPAVAHASRAFPTA